MSDQRKVYRTGAGEMVEVASKIGFLGGLFDWLFSSLAVVAFLAFIFGTLAFVVVIVVLAILTAGLELFELDEVMLVGSSAAIGFIVAIYRLLGGEIQLVVADLRSVGDRALYLMAGPGGIACSIPDFSFRAGYQPQHVLLRWSEISGWTRFSGNFGIEQLIIDGNDGGTVVISMLPYRESMDDIAEAIQRAASDPDLDPDARQAEG
jgi:hypothetical protein